MPDVVQLCVLPKGDAMLDVIRQCVLPKGDDGM